MGYGFVQTKNQSADGNKNVIALYDTDGILMASYSYGPFGQLLSAEGPLAAVNPFRFSSEYFDDETDLVYYNYRYYSPRLGRWLSRDPIGEDGGLNLYGMLGNDAVNSWDELGLAIAYPLKDKPGYARFKNESYASAVERTGLLGNWFEKLNPGFSITPVVNGCYKVVINLNGDASLLAKIAYAEGTSNSKDDKWAVPTLVVNRVNFHKTYPHMYSNTILGVISTGEFTAYNGTKWKTMDNQDFPNNIMTLKEWNWSAVYGESVSRGELYQGIKGATVMHSNSYDHPAPNQVGSGWTWELTAKVGNHRYFTITKL